MSRLNLAVLGTPHVHHSQQELHFRTRKALALLVYLAVEGGMHSREKVATLFWPDSDEAQARASLRRSLLDLRRALGDTAGTSHLIVRSDALGFDFTSDVDIDCAHLAKAFTFVSGSGVDKEVNSASHDDLFSQLAQAATLYRGAFLDGFAVDDAPDFDDWVWQQRATWQQRSSLLFDRLSQRQLDGGKLAAALETASRWLVCDPLNDVAHQRLIQAHLVAGNRMAALHAYEAYRVRLSEEMHVTPSTETEALAAHIRAVTNSSSVSELASPSPSLLSSFALPTRALRDIESPLVGRANEYITMIETYQTAQRGQAQILLLKGEAGIGKTRLASDFLSWAKGRGADVLTGRAFETGSGLAYQPLVEAFRNRIELENAPDDLLGDIWLMELSRLFPELRERYPDLPSPRGDETTASIRLFEAIARLGQALAERAPLVLFIDDLQWADAASLDVLHYAMRRWTQSDSRVFLLLTLRTEALSTMRSLSAWLSRLEHDLPVTDVALNCLSLQDIVQLVQTLGRGGRTSKGAGAGEAPTAHLERFGRWLFDETHGQPFYVAETLNVLLERGMLALRFHPDGRQMIDFTAAIGNEAELSGLLPVGVRAVIQARLAQLSTHAFALLAAGSVLDHDFTFEQLCQISGIDEPEGIDALEELLAGCLLQGASDKEALQPAIYSFLHDKIRDVMYTEAGEARRRMLHRRALDLLQRTASSPAVLAHHAYAGGLKESAFQLGVAAGNDAMRLFAIRDAIALYERARQLLEEGYGKSGSGDLRGSIPFLMVLHLYLQLGRAYELATEWEQASSIYRTLLQLAQESEIPMMACAAINRQAMLTALIHFDLEQAVELAEQALEIARDSDDPLVLAESEWTMAQLGIYRFDANAVLTYGEHALERTRIHGGQQELIARCLNVTAYGQMMVGNWEEAAKKAREARILYVTLKNHTMEGDCLCVLANASIYGGQPRVAIEAARVAHTMSMEIDNVVGQLYSGFHLAIGLLEIGAYSEAMGLAQRGLDIARTQSVPSFLSVYLTLLGKVHRVLLNLKAAHAAHLEALGYNETLMSRSFTGMIMAELCADSALEHGWTEAYRYAAKGQKMRETLFHLYTGLTFWFETEALLSTGDVEQAVLDVRYLKEHLGRSRRYHLPYLRAEAVLASHRGEIAEAIDYLNEAAQLAEEIGLPGEAWMIQAELGEMHGQQGSEEMASQAFVRAGELLLSLADKLEEGQRATFLSADPARRVLERTQFSL